MSLWENIFGSSKKSAESVAFFEVGSDSIAGGFAYFTEGGVPLLAYTSRLPIQLMTDEPQIKAVSRALELLGQGMIQVGAPLLARAAGSGRINSVLVSVKAPWQETSVRSEKIERATPFVFTKALLNTALLKSAEPPPGRLLADEFVVGTVLDGYTIKRPVGKRASRANVIVLSSCIDEPLSRSLAEGIRKLFHTTSMRLVAAAAIRYDALRAVFPHEEDYLIVDISDSAIVTTLVRRELLSAVEHAVVNMKDAWLQALVTTFEAITKRYPLPRKIFLLVNESDRASVKQKIENMSTSSLRLSVEPAMVVPIAPAHLTDTVRLGENVEPDLGIELMVAFWQRTER